MKIIFRFILLIVAGGFFTQCNSAKPVKSIEDLKIAFNSESMASGKYAKFSQKAMEEGYDTIAKLFDATSKSKKIHAFNLGKILEKYGSSIENTDIGSYEIKTTLENLQSVIIGETYEIQTMFPGFIKNAEKEKAAEAAKSFTWAWDCEKKHLNYYRQVESAIGKGNENGLYYNWYICPICGNVYNNKNLKDSCDFCLTKKAIFIGYTEEFRGE